MAGIITPLRRLATKRSWCDSHGVGLVVWMVLAVLFAMLLLVFLTLLADVLTSQGGAVYRAATAVADEGQVLTIPPDEGLGPQVARFHGRPLWSWLDPVYERVLLLRSTRGALLVLVLGTLICALLTAFARSQARVNAAHSARQAANWLRNSIHRQTLRLGPSDMTGRRYQSALRYFIDDSETIRDSLGEWRWRLVRGIVFIPALILCPLLIDWRLGLQCLLPAVACWWIYRFERERGARRRQIADSHAETEVRFLSEALKQTRLVRGYNIEEFEQALFAKHVERMAQQASTGRRLERAAISTARLITWMILAFVLLLICFRVVSPISPLPLSSGIVIAICLAWLSVELSSFERVFQLQSEIDVTGDRIYRYLDEIPEVGQAVGAKFIQPVAKSIILESVHYQHQGHEILRGLDLRIEAHTEVALVSLDPLLPKAVAYLLPRFIEPNRGRVLFDGEDIAWGTLESIRAETCYLAGDDPVLSGSVLDNIICGDSRYSQTDAMEAAKLVHAHKFISRLPQGYDTILGEQGEQLNVGEAFRLSLARAILRDPAVMIIEEPQVLLDEDTKNLIDDAYQRLSNNRTLIYLPARLSTIRRCDHVVMLHEGIVDGIGSHSDLAKGSALYRHWDYLNFNTFSRRSRRIQQA